MSNIISMSLNYVKNYALENDLKMKEIQIVDKKMKQSLKKFNEDIIEKIDFEKIKTIISNINKFISKNSENLENLCTKK